ncbi:MAG: DNA polymerase III subunit gamma/tau [Candidatus Omnitrophica bacterium]|nr:DNA polymerase III subunit gamma/tau [Candidatus Omnitrophota bacterium]
MTYTVFSLTWRPKVFSQIIGQEHIVKQLTQAIEKDRLGHAFLFAGPRGVGKTSTARILAKALNCQEGPTVNPCGKCSTCIDIANSRCLDVIEIDGASNRGIDEIRALRENVKFAPTNGRFKIYIIDEVHQITADGFNALLKTLEEPPEFVKFIFATTHPQKVPATILSRCQRFDFRRISVLEIINQLKKICAAENITASEEVLAAIARASDGALRDAETILDQLVSFSKGNISIADVNAMLGQVQQQALFDLTDAVIQEDAQKALILFNKLLDEGKDPAVLLSELIGHFRNLMVAKVAQVDSRLIDLPQELCERLVAQSAKLRLEEILAAFNALVNAQDLAKRLESHRIPLEITLVKLCCRLTAQDKSVLSTQQTMTSDSVNKRIFPPAHHPSSTISSTGAVQSKKKTNKDNPSVLQKNNFSTGKNKTLERQSVQKQPSPELENLTKQPVISPEDNSSVQGISCSIKIDSQTNTCKEMTDLEQTLLLDNSSAKCQSNEKKVLKNFLNNQLQDEILVATKEQQEDKQEYRLKELNSQTKDSLDTTIRITNQEQTSSKDISLKSIQNYWEQVASSLKTFKMFIASYLREGIPSELKKDTLVISFHKNHSLYKETLERKENRQMVEKAILDTLNVPLKVQFVLSNDEKTSNSQMENPAVQSVIQTFKARLINED